METVAKTEYLRKTEEAFAALTNHEEIRPYVSRYLCALLNSLEAYQHPALKSLHRLLVTMPEETKEQIARSLSGDREPFLLESLAERVEQVFPRFKEVYEDDLARQLRRIACSFLAAATTDESTKQILEEAEKKVRLKLERTWDNPIRFLTGPVSGKAALGDIGARTPMALIMNAQAFLKTIDPAGPPGRRKGATKPKGSGKAPLPAKESLAVFQAIEGDGKDWKYCARTILKKKIPSEHKERERLRAYISRLKHNGSLP